MRFQKIPIPHFCLILLLSHFCFGTSYAQQRPTQTVRGVVVDKHTQKPIPGATVIISNLNPVKADVTDPMGRYRIENVPVGRIDVECAFLGYHSIVHNNMILNSGRELIINFDLKEKSQVLDEFVVSAYSRKDRPVNRMAVISTRSFTLEETGRYAGSYGDPARMAANYAGVMTGSDTRNDIIIRGNSSIGIMWRLNGIEISNPSHYAALGTTGGPITLLNTNLLASSDFLSGAFPASFGNALAGVFDLNMRNGNNEKHEHWLQAGWNGLEVGTEGPFTKNYGGSYLLAYRYSILDILNTIGIDMGIDPKYQDLNFKVHLPYNKGKFDIIGLGGKSAIKIFDTHKSPDAWLFENAGENLENSAAAGVVAISNMHIINNYSRFHSSVAVSGSEVATRIDTFSIAEPEPFTKAGEKSSEKRYTLSTSWLYKLSEKSDFETGVIYDIYDYNYNDSTYSKTNYILNTNAQGIMALLRTYGQVRYHLRKNLTAVGGINYQSLSLNKVSALEPRLALRWDINPKHSLSAGFGLHSQMQPRMIYFVKTPLTDGSHMQTNRNLGFSKSRHYIIGHDYLITNDWRLKTEAYFQQLYNIPVKESLGAYAVINAGVEYFIAREDSLTNDGKGQNYGIEITLEKFFSNNYFLMLTASVFNSVFQGADNIMRSTAFNSNFLINSVAGYEHKIGPHKNSALIFGARFTYNGGRPYVPFNSEATVRNGYEVLDWDNAYKEKHPSYIRASLRLGMRRNKPRYSSELTIDLQYRTHYTNIYDQRIDIHTGKVYTYQEVRLYPISTWRLNF